MHTRKYVEIMIDCVGRSLEYLSNFRIVIAVLSTALDLLLRIGVSISSSHSPSNSENHSIIAFVQVVEIMDTAVAVVRVVVQIENGDNKQ